MSQTTDIAPSYGRLVNYFGSEEMVSRPIAGQLVGRPLVVIPFAGSMAVLQHLTAAKVLVSDLHRQLINLAEVLKHPTLGPKLYRRLKREVFHPDTLRRAQEVCRLVEDAGGDDVQLFASGLVDRRFEGPDVDWAASYAICSWMGRGGSAGTDSEFRGALPIRYSPNGGGSAQRFHNWVASIPAWRRMFRRCEFTLADAFDMLAASHDAARVGIYCDPPWVSAGLKYRHKFQEADHRKLARVLGQFTSARVVLRYGDEPLIRALYPSIEQGGAWRWLRNPSRSQANSEVDEVLILNGPEQEGEGA